ncbi:MAG: tRNA1(Val) (adenine(37)-N6)-methyltransferase [Desulfosalsimonas sp.]
MNQPADYTFDTFFNGRISVKQPPNGYRFSIDAVILGNLAAIQAGDRVLDLGCGCGVIPLILCYRNPDIAQVFGVEIQAELAAIARLNAEENHMNRQIRILHQDMKTLEPVDTSGSVDAVVCNPPHFAQRSGRINPDSQRALARHEIAVTIADVTAAAARMLAATGRFTVIYPCERMVDLVSAMRTAGIEPKRLRVIHPRPGTEARRVLAVGVKGGHPGLKTDPPLFIRQDRNHYSEELEAMFGP